MSSLVQNKFYILNLTQLTQPSHAMLQNYNRQKRQSLQNLKSTIAIYVYKREKGSQKGTNLLI